MIKRIESHAAPRIVTTASVNGLLEHEALILFIELLFPGGNLVAFLRCMVQGITGSKAFTTAVVDETCARLVKRGYLKLVRRMASADHREYKAHVRYDSGALAALRDLAMDRHWFPEYSLVLDAFQSARRYVSYESSMDYEHPLTAYQRVMTLRSLLGVARFRQSSAITVTSDGAFDGACFLTGFLTDDVRLLTGALDGAVEAQLLPAAMSAFFFAGRDVGGMLDQVQKAARSGETFPAVAVLTYGALRVWRGEIGELSGMDAWVVTEDELRVRGIESAFTCAASGQWEAANVTFASIIASRLVSEGNPILYPFLALVFAIGLQVGMPEAKLRKLYRQMLASVPRPATEDRWGQDKLRGKVAAWAGSRLTPFEWTGSAGINAPVTLEHILEDLQPSFGTIPLCFALRAPVLASRGADRDVTIDECSRHLLQQATKVIAAGYLGFGALLLSGYSRFGDLNAPEYLRALDTVTKSRVPWLLPCYDRENEWKDLVTGLAKIVGMGPMKAEKAVKQKRGAITWGIMILEDLDETRFDGSPEVVSCGDVSPYYRGPRASDDGSDDRHMTPNGVQKKEYANLLTEQDHRILNELLRMRYNSLRDSDVPMSIIEQLVDHPHVIETFLAGGYATFGDVDRPPCAIALTRLAWHVSSQQTDDGGLLLSLPAYMAEAVDGPCLVRFGLKDFRFLKLSERECAFVSGFFAVAPDGVVRLPAQALETASPVLTAMARFAPMEGNLGAIAGTSDLERVPGETVPTARLAFHDDTLDVALCVKPYAKNAALVLKPGAGSPERMVKDGKATQVLVRNLAAEASAAKKVEDALADFAGWADGDGGWKVANLVDALGVLATLRDMGDDVLMEWREGDRLNVLTKISTKGGLTSQGGIDRWFRIDGKFEIDENLTYSLYDLLKAFRGRVGRFIPLGEKGYLRISSALARRLEALDAAGRERDGHVAIAPAALPMLDGAFARDDGGVPLPKAMAVEADRVHAAFAAKHGVPERLKATLRPYQEEGYAWLARLADCGFGACLADDMGLGKTVQLIALLLAQAKEGASLVVAPTSVGGNWRREIERFAPTLNCLCAWETGDAVWQKASAHDIVITSYGMLVSRAEKFLAREWNGVILDEAQAIKNESTERARIAKKLVAKFRVAATGTPIENRLTELWSIFDFLNPGMLGTSNEFIARLTNEGHATPALKNLVRPLILRRLKREVLDDLPDKTEITLTVDLDETERAGYEACRRKALETLAQGGQENRISILAELTRLRRYCCHPSLVMPGMADSAKMEALVELLRDLKGANHRVLVFSQFTDYLALVQRRLQSEGISFQYLDGATSPKERERRVADFQKGEGDVFLMSLKAGGTGINLTAANYVVLLDPWWNPAVEDQAADRVHRIGQKQPVTVYRLIAADTVEERVLELHAEKKQLATDVLDGTASSALTPEVLMKLFG